MDICLCFFGITRSLTWTAPSIMRNIVEPARQQGPVRILGHFYTLPHLTNPRSHEDGPISQDEHALLPFDEIEWADPEEVLAGLPVEDLRRYGDAWNDDFHSFRNLLLQLHSLQSVTHRALEGGAENVLFCRPDLEYHDSAGPALGRAGQQGSQRLYLPNWQWNGGYNDRFALARGRSMIERYGNRITRAADYCATTGQALHSESLLKFALGSAPISDIGMRATRVRVGGAWHPESNFYPPWLAGLLSWVKARIGGTIIERPAHALWKFLIAARQSRLERKTKVR